MEMITVTAENIETEHICCAISSNKDPQVMAKKAWMKERFQDGLVFRRFDARGKCFIEYIPAEQAWMPVEADGYMVINCLWVAGKFQGQGLSSQLLEACLKDSREQGKKGVAILSSVKKKMPFLSDPKYLNYKGFLLADTAEPFYALYYLPFEADAAIPKFKEQVKNPRIEEQGFVLYYTNQCPFTAKYVPLIQQMAEAKGVPFQTVHLTTAEAAQNAPAPFTSYSLFYNGGFVTNEILSEKKFEKLLKENGYE